MRQGQKVKGIQIRRNALAANHLLVMGDYLFFLFLVCLVEEKNGEQKNERWEKKKEEKKVCLVGDRREDWKSWGLGVFFLSPLFGVKWFSPKFGEKMRGNEWV